ncbi:Mismatch repair endonuclease PMS2 [Babesia microti strain RI]|uniref:Mismatch repair endonuclease PMS2 n=1 Tax=Babesia microti (strain RI) TaxID=1133968 RepID=A0A1N6LWU9_BABMR|nr:Mismatch repair endonuclease PMS2 [Babesia microti strain RI]SIO73343.1 Mismatch repair endonuclease PMS2 [Babesia microti strain RI]|eukprot:XP_021337445.1 Mismatch repair endonuclease PMS2 [Babesia microti strain RI]
MGGGRVSCYTLTMGVGMNMKVISEPCRNESSSLQLLVDVSCVVKELLENALDASATEIDVSLVDGGCESIEVKDNGTGIREEDFELLAIRNTTSKISKFEDLTTRLSTFGFRGEALHSIATLSTLVVKTRIRDSTEGWNLTFDHQGNLLSKVKCLMSLGTIVTSIKLFSVFPVRRQQLIKGWANKIKFTVDMVQQYALFYPSIRITLTNKPTNGKTTILFSSPGNYTSIRDITSFIYGKKLIQKMNEWGYTCDEFEISGLISDLDSEFNPPIQILFVNGRPVTSQKSICHAILNAYRQYSNKARPSFILNLTLNLQEIDVNCSPDKRTIYITIEEYIITTIKIQLHKFFEAQGINTKSGYIVSMPTLDISQAGRSKHTLSDITNLHKLHNSPDKSSLAADESQQAASHENSIADSGAHCFKLKRYKVECDEPFVMETESEAVFGFENTHPTNGTAIRSSGFGDTKNCKVNEGVDLSQQCNYIVERVLCFDLKQYKQQSTLLKQHLSQKKLQTTENTTKNAISHDPKRIEKRTFKMMEICGQFNKGFIITKLASYDRNDKFKYSLFIIDQHAADEKARFETLNKRVKINCQKLIQPVFVKVPPSHLAVALDNASVLECNGFTMCGSSDHGLYIATFPVLFSHVLGENDFLEFLEKIYSFNAIYGKDLNGTSSHVWDYFQSTPRPPKIWSILANRACRSAVKIGDDLNRGKMEQIKDTLGDLDHPWNCPHGRPTIKCLATAAELTAAAQNLPCQFDFI